MCVLFMVGLGIISMYYMEISIFVSQVLFVYYYFVSLRELYGTTHSHTTH